jgi:hypothetical protein
MSIPNREHGIRGWLSSSHCTDLKASLAWARSLSITVAVVAIAGALLPIAAPLFRLDPTTVPKLELSSLVQILAALIAANLVYFQFIATSANARAGVAAVLVGEIKSIANALHQFGIIELIADGLARVDTNTDDWKNMRRIMGATGEQYMQAYEKNIDRIANLRDDAVLHVSAFYTDFKASRDASRAIGRWSENTTSASRKSDMFKVLRLLQSSLGNGASALIALSENEDADSPFRSMRKQLDQLLAENNSLSR